MEIPHANLLKFDPRPIGGIRGHTFSFFVKGTTLTVTRTDSDEGWDEFKLRAYMPTEVVPDFTSTVYLYHGLDGEKAPKDVTKVIIHKSVTTIKRYAFDYCRSLVRVTMHGGVKRIEKGAFYACISLRFIRFSGDLEYIGESAFFSCKSIEGVFLPPAVKQIDDWAFNGCNSLRFLYVPESIEHIGYKVVYGCTRLLTAVSAVKYSKSDDGHPVANNYDVNEWLKQRHKLLSLHEACYSTSISDHSVSEIIQVHGIECATKIDEHQMSALHILCANPHVTGDAIRAYLSLAPEAINEQDLHGMTPFQYLCRNDVTFLDDREFSTLMTWWYGCLP